MPPLSLPPLVSASWLAAELGASDLVTLDASWYLPGTGRDARAEFLASHIPGAFYFDLDAASDHHSPLPHMLPDPESFAEYAGSLGVGDGDRVVVYDTSGSNLSAARAWWMFRAFGVSTVTLLDGGLRQWRTEGRHLEVGERTPRPARLTPHAQPAGVVDQEAVRGALRQGTAQVVDMRSAGRFRGTEPEPRPGLPSGHMPGALNLPYTELVHPDGRALSVDELRSRLAAAGIRLDQPVVATCGSGVTACTLLHALERLGRHDGKLYDGSWTEWVGAGGAVARGGEP